MLIRFMTSTDLEETALVHRLAFPRQQHSLAWLQCNLNAAPRFLNFVAVVDTEMDDKRVVAYIIWTQKSGFRAEVVLELEQLAVHPDFQGKGIGRALITESLVLVKKHLAEHAATLKHILVTTRADNMARKLYQETLGAEVEVTISNLYSADEVLMIARNVSN